MQVKGRKGREKIFAFLHFEISELSEKSLTESDIKGFEKESEQLNAACLQSGIVYNKEYERESERCETATERKKKKENQKTKIIFLLPSSASLE